MLKDFMRSARSAEAVELAERRFVSTIYFHTLFLFAATKSRRYALQRSEGDDSVDVEVADYVADLFGSAYAQFLLTFDTADLVDALG